MRHPPVIVVTVLVLTSSLCAGRDPATTRPAETWAPIRPTSQPAPADASPGWSGGSAVTLADGSQVVLIGYDDRCVTDPHRMPLRPFTLALRERHGQAMTQIPFCDRPASRSPPELAPSELSVWADVSTGIDDGQPVLLAASRPVPERILYAVAQYGWIMIAAVEKDSQDRWRSVEATRSVSIDARGISRARIVPCNPAGTQADVLFYKQPEASRPDLVVHLSIAGEGPGRVVHLQTMGQGSAGRKE